MTICAATKWPTNAEMVVDIVELGYIKPTDAVIDLTFGRGKWWTKYQHRHPGRFVANLDVEDRAYLQPIAGWEAWHYDYRDLPGGDVNDSFDVVVFDPPYVSVGGRATSTMPDFQDRYGLTNAATTPELLQKDIDAGLAAAERICKPGGLILVKCAPYISSGKYKPGDLWTHDTALYLGLEIHDRLFHVGHVRAQPGGRKVKHARNNLSILYVFRKPAPRKPRKKKAT